MLLVLYINREYAIQLQKLGDEQKYAIDLPLYIEYLSFIKILLVLGT